MFKTAAFADESSASLEGQIEALKRNGISLLEIRGIGDKKVPDLDVSEVKSIRRALDCEGISVWSLASLIGKVEIADGFRAHFDLFRRTLEYASVLGASRIRLFSFYHTDIPVNDALRDEVIERMGRFTEEAKKSDIVLCHENEKGIFGETVEGCLEMHRALPSLRAAFDPANFAVCGEDPLKAWEALFPYVDYMHVKDVAQNGTIVPAGEGICNLSVIIRSYLEKGGSVMTVEPHLFPFEGLSSLEKSGAKSVIAGLRYPSAEEAFDAAVKAFRDLTSELN